MRIIFHSWKMLMTEKTIFSRLSPATLLKKRLWQRCFPVNFEKFLRTSFLYSGRLLVIVIKSDKILSIKKKRKIKIQVTYKTQLCAAKNKSLTSQTPDEVLGIIHSVFYGLPCHVNFDKFKNLKQLFEQALFDFNIHLLYKKIFFRIAKQKSSKMIFLNLKELH